MAVAAEIEHSRSAVRRAAWLEVPHCPHEPTQRQRLFLSLREREAMYGGAAGGGKSDALLMGALEYVDVPGYSAICFRRTHQDLKLPGALLDRSKEWLLGSPRIHWNENDKQWTFLDSGARITFGYMDNEADKYRYKSAEFQYVAFDELTQFSESQYLYMHSRLRRPQNPANPLSRVPLRMRGGTNPGDVGHRWVKRRFIEPGDPSRPFVPAKLDDNPHVDAVSYREGLAQMDQTSRDQLEHGLWVLDDSQRIYRFDPEKHLVPALPTRADDRWLDDTLWRWIFVVDLGASPSSATTGLARLAWHPNLPATYVTRAWREKGMIPSTIAELVEAEVKDHPGVTIVFDQGGLGIGYIEEMRRRYSLPVYPAEKRDKAPTRRLMNGAIERGELLLVRGQCEELEEELVTLVWDAAGRDAAPGLADHCSDALLYGWRWSRAWASEAAPAASPVYGSPAWYEAQREQQEARDRQAYQERQQLEEFERW